MGKIAVVKTGGKQYLVKEGETIVVEKLPEKKGEIIDLPVLALFEDQKKDLEIGNPLLKRTVKAEVVENDLKGEKIRVARFKAKVRYRRVRGFRPMLTKIKIVKI